MATATTCPKPEMLEDLLANRLPADVAGQVREHIAGCQACKTRLNPPAGPSALERFTFLSPPRGDGEMGWLGTYRIRSLLGEGGMAFVFEAEDEVLHRTVALKVLKPDLADPNLRDRFMREARTLAGLSHEHIVTIYGVSEDNGVVFLAMEKLVGETLEVRLDRDSWLPVIEALALTREAAEGLAVAHAGGLVHRDVKPSNLWLETSPLVQRRTASRAAPHPSHPFRDVVNTPLAAACVGDVVTTPLAAALGQFKRVKLIDFGIARAVSGDSSLTISNMVVGTPAYMSPEQAVGMPLDGRSDLYSLGCVLFRMLTGDTPFSAGNDTRLLLQKVASNQAPDISRARLPVAVADLLRQLLAIKPHDRPASAEVLIERLRRLEQEQSSMRMAPTAGSPSPRHGWTGRRPALVGIWLGAITIVAAVVIGALAAFYKFRPQETEDAEGGEDGTNVVALKGEPIKVGILHSQTGTFSIHEKPIIWATLLAVKEINDSGGVLGRPLKTFVANGESEEKIFESRARQLIEKDKVEVLFGVWTASARKRVERVCAENERLLFYPSASEGLEESPNVVYLGGIPNQMVIPLVRWAYSHEHRRRFFLVGSDYLYSHVVNEIIKHELLKQREKDGAEFLRNNVSTHYALLGETDFTGVIADIKKKTGTKEGAEKSIILCSIDGQSNVAFFQALRKAGIRPSQQASPGPLPGVPGGRRDVPTVWFNVAESELSLFRIKDMKGDFSVGCYFSTIERPENQAFLARFHKQYGDGEPVGDAMATAYFGVYAWKKAVEQAGGTALDPVRKALRNLVVEAPEGPIRIAPSQYAYRTGLVGQFDVHDGRAQITIVNQTPRPVAPEPFPSWKTPAEWKDFLHDLYVKWDNHWEKHR